MHTLTAPESPTVSLRELDNVVHSLWAHEPDSRFGERHHLLNTLRQLSIEVERQVFRQAFQRDEDIDLAEFDQLTQRTAMLAANWSSDLWVSTPWPTDLLGERAQFGSS